MAGNAKVLQQHVAGKNVRRRQLLDGQAVILQRLQHLAFAGMLQVQVQWRHAPLGPAVTDQYRVTLQYYRRRRHLQQFGQALRRELALWEAKIGKLLGIGQAPHAVDAFHQPVLVDHRRAVDGFRWREAVLDDLEHGVEARQGEHAHDHAAYPGRHDEAVVAAGQVVDQRPVELRLAVLVETDGGVQLGNMLARQDTLEEVDELCRHRHIDHEIGAGEGKDDRHLGLVRDQAIGLDTMPFAVQQRYHQRPLLIAVVQPADQVGTLVAVQHRRKQLHRQRRVFANPIRQALAQLLFKARHVAFKVAIGECVVGKNGPQQALKIAIGAVGTGLCGTLVAADGRPGGVDEHAAVADLVMAEQAAEQ
ncbi:hypothetical protein D3C81_1309310 [compost metagenome]